MTTVTTVTTFTTVTTVTTVTAVTTAIAWPIIVTTTFFSKSDSPSAEASRSRRGRRIPASTICCSRCEMRSCSRSAFACSLRARFDSCRACSDA